MKNIVLCGFMGCGKTTVGKAMAKMLNAEFVDTDAYIEGKSGLSVSDIFAGHGEAYFRKLEKRAVCELSQRAGLIISTGGGTVLNAENAESLKSGGTIVNLDVPVEIIKKRLASDRSRPLLNRPDRDGALLELYNRRAPIYRSAADITVENTNGMPAEETAALILSRLKAEGQLL